VSETLGMAQHEVTRTLVKSQPEIWTQCSDADSLGRHLSSSFGEIRITRLEPEHSVAWEGEEVSGTVKIEPSAWGTRVTMAVEVEGDPVVAEVEEHPMAPQRDVGSLATQPEEEPMAPDPDHTEPHHEQVLPALTAVGAGAPEQSTPPPAPGPDAPPPEAAPDHVDPPGLFARMWGRFRRPSEPALVHKRDELDQTEAPQELADPELVAGPEALAEPEALTEPEPDPVPITEPEIEELMPIQVTAQSTREPEAEHNPDPEPQHTPEPEPAEPENDLVVALNAALESLGQAHHRPFSRA
jgi:hypothetical protein